jgi:hypothetical protein
MNDVRKMIYVTLIGFLAVVVLWLSLLYVSACGFTFSCNKYKPVVERTSIPTLIPVKRSGTQTQAATTEFNKCEVSATALIGAWVSAGAPETDAFPFSDVNGQPCEGTFEADIQRLFVENSLWYPGAIGCVSCHNAALTERSAGLDLTSYEAMQMGSSRTDANAKGSDIFGGGNWEKSTLFTVLVNQGMVPIGHSADVSANDFILYAGTAVEPTATPSP